jgi:DNA-binding beta-propeller fold protein YncE
MSHTRRSGLILLALVSMVGAQVVAQAPAWPNVQPTNDAPNPYETINDFFKLPEGRAWGATSAVDVSPDSKIIWVAERCAANTCWDATKGAMSTLDTVFAFEAATGKLIRSFGAGMFVFPHGIHVDRDGNVWVTDGNDNLPRRARGAAPDAPLPPAPAKVVGHQVIKFSPDGKVLMTLGKAGGNRAGQPAEQSSFYQPNDIITLPNGDILVAEGHSDAENTSHRIVRFSRDGKFMSEFGKRGNGPGEFIQPHGLALDAQGRLYVADRSNNRIQVVTTDGKHVADWPQLSRPSGVYVRGDMIYSADSESGTVNPPHQAWHRGIRGASIKDGTKVLFFIPDPSQGKPDARGTLAAEGVAVDAAGNIYGAEVGPRQVVKYVRKKGS